MTDTRHVAVGGLRTRPPFRDLFPIDPKKRAEIAAHVRAHGFDDHEGLDVWRETDGHLTVVDGHTRLAVAKELGIAKVPVKVYDFADAVAALEHTLHKQRDRRNLDGIALLKAIQAVDRELRESHGGSRNPIGRNQHSEVNLSPDKLTSPRISHVETAKIIGTSPSMVTRARQVYDDPIAVKEVEAGSSISGAAERAMERRNGARGRPGPKPSPRDRPDDEPWFRAADHGGIVASICVRAAAEIGQRLELARDQGLDLSALMREDKRVRTAWNVALDEARATVRLVRKTINAAEKDED